MQEPAIDIHNGNRCVYLDDETGEWVVEFVTGEVARSTSRQAIEALLDYADNNQSATE